MIRTLVGLPALLIALVPQTPVMDAPASGPSPVASIAPVAASARGGPVLLQGTIIQGPALIRSMPPPMAHMQRLMDIKRSFRRTMLAALTPAHRTILAQIIGELAISPDPDVESATRRLNAVLSVAEAEAILRAEQAQQLATQQAFAQMIAAEPGSHLSTTFVLHGEVHAMPPRIMSGAGGFNVPAPFGSDPGSILLRTAAETVTMPNIGMSGQLRPLDMAAPHPR